MYDDEITLTPDDCDILEAEAWTDSWGDRLSLSDLRGLGLELADSVREAINWSGFDTSW